MKDLNITVSNETKELVLRTGEADKIVHPKGINITGVLGAPYQFLIGKDIDPKTSHLQIKRDTGGITLNILDTNPHSSSTIIGQLKKDSALESWKINSVDHRWTVQGFLRHIKTQAFYFTSKDELKAMVDSLQKWNATVETVIQQHNANTGNSLSVLEKKVSGIELKNKFSITIPIFQGYEKQKFTVEIGLDPKSNSVDLFLISDELFSLEIEHREALIEAELNKFSTFPCSKVVIS
jgi:hypothetical protein